MTKARVNRGTGVNDNADAQGQIDLLVEGVHMFRRLPVVEQGKVALLQISNVVAVLVSDGEDEVDFVDRGFEGGDAHVGAA